MHKFQVEVAKVDETKDNHAERLEKLEAIRILLNDSLWALADENVSLNAIIDGLRSDLAAMDERMKVLRHLEPLEDHDLDIWAEKYLVKRRDDGR